MNTYCYRIEKGIETKVDYEAQIRQGGRWKKLWREGNLRKLEEQTRFDERKAIGVYLRKELYWHCNTTDINEITKDLLDGRFPTWHGDDYCSPSPERIREVNQVLWGEQEDIYESVDQKGH